MTRDELITHLRMLVEPLLDELVESSTAFRKSGDRVSSVHCMNLAERITRVRDQTIDQVREQYDELM